MHFHLGAARTLKRAAPPEHVTPHSPRHTFASLL
jgi:integrase